MTQRAGWILLTLSAGLILYGLVAARLGFFIIDEVIYVFAVETFARTGSFVLDNGLQLLNSGDLFWSDLLSLGPNGITSQYPPGTTLVWAPLVEMFGIRGIIVFNAAAMAGALFATRALALQLFHDDWIALVACLLFLFGTFALEYAFVIWPHAISVCTVTASFVFFLRAMEDRSDALWQAMLSGLILGAGLLFRIDNVLALSVFALLAVLYAAYPMRVFLGGALGMAPALAVLSAVNLTKFGTLNPLSYGGKEGGTNIMGYLPYGVALLVLLILLSLVRTRKLGDWRIWAGGGALALVVLCIAVPPFQKIAFKLVQGLHTLVLDAREIRSWHGGVQAMPDGTQSFWGLSKKAVGQSLPWLGLLLLLVHPRAWRGQGRAIACALIFSVVFVVPFLLRSWHGGMSSNMRYFLPVMPPLAILAAAMLQQLLARTEGALRPFLWAIPLGVLMSLAWMFLFPTGLAGAHQIMSLYVFLAVMTASMLAALVPIEAVARITLLVAGVGIGVSVFNTGTDVLVSQLRRATGEVLTDTANGFEGRVLIYDRMLRSALMSPDQVVASPMIGSDLPDIALVQAALTDGYRVLMPDEWAIAMAEAYPEFQWADIDGPVDLAEIALR